MSYNIDLKLTPTELMFGLFNFHNNHTYDGADVAFSGPLPSDKVGFPDKVTVTALSPIEGIDVPSAVVHYTRIDIARLFSTCKLELLDKWLTPTIDVDAIKAAVLYRYGVNLSTGFSFHTVVNRTGEFAVTAALSNVAYKGTANITVVKSLSEERVKVTALSDMKVIPTIVPFDAVQEITWPNNWNNNPDYPPYSLDLMYGTTHAFMVRDASLMLLDVASNKVTPIVSFNGVPNYAKKINNAWSLGDDMETIAGHIELFGDVGRLWSTVDSDWNVSNVPNLRYRVASKILTWKGQTALAFLAYDRSIVVNKSGLQLTKVHSQIHPDENVRSLDTNKEKFILVGEKTARTVSWIVNDAGIIVSTAKDLKCSPDYCAELVRCRTVGEFTYDGKSGYLMVNESTSVDAPRGYFVSLEDLTVSQVIVADIIKANSVAIGSMKVYGGGVIANKKDDSKLIYQPLKK